MDGPYTVASAEDMVPAVTATAFAAGGEGWVSAVDAGIVRLPAVRCRSVSPDGDGPPRLHAVRAEDVPIQRPIGMPDAGSGFQSEVAHPALTVSCLHRAVCLPGGIVVRDDAVLVNSFAATWDTREHRHLRRAADGRWQLPPGPGPDPARLPVVEQPVLHLDHQHIDWFGHVIADLLSPGWAYEYCRAFLNVGRLLVLCSAPRYAFVRHLVAALGVPDRDLVLIDGPVLCRRLLLATKAMQVQGYVSAPAVRLWQGMRNRVVRDRPAAADRIYVSRRANPTRRLVEEEAVEAAFAAHGFRIVHPEGHDIHEQMRLFAGARLIAGCGGSNMFNLAFQGRAEAVLVLVSPLLIHRSEQFLCARPDGGASLDVLIGHVREADMLRHPGSVHAPWHLDPVLVGDVVSDWLRGTG